MNTRELKNWAEKTNRKAVEQLEMLEFNGDLEVVEQLEAVATACQELATACDAATE